MKNRDSVVAGFTWQRPENVARDGSWRRDLALALIIAVASLFLLMIGNAYSKPRLSQQITSINNPPHDLTAILATASED